MPAKPKKEPIKCYCCNGEGVLRHYNHIADGKCFKCGGSGLLGYRSANTIGYAKRFVLDFYGIIMFPNEPLFPKDQYKMTVLEVIYNHGHPTAEYKVLKDNDFYYVGQPVCRGGNWYAVPISQWEEFKKHWNRCRAFKVKDGLSNKISV